MSLNISFFTQHGTVGNYQKTMKLKRKWEDRERTGDFRSKETTARSSANTSSTQKTSDMIRDMLKEESQKIIDAYKENEHNNNSDKKLSDIRTKAMYGQDLSPDEMEYIKSKDPQLYQSIKAEKDEIKHFEKKLKAAKTKEEAQRVVTDEANAALSKVNAVTNNPHIPESAKMSVCVSEYRKLMKKQETFDKFVDKGEYEKLPTEAEKRKAEKEIMEAREEELRNAGKAETSEDENEDDSEDTSASLLQSSDNVNDRFNDEYTGGRAATQKPMADTLVLSSRGRATKPVFDDSANKAERKPDSPGTKTYESTEQARSSPEARKVEEAKRKSSYGKLFSQEDEQDSGSVTFKA